MTDSPRPEASYRVLAAPCRHTLEEKRSLFHTHLFPVTDREAALACIEQLRREQPGASHYCWAYLLGPADQPRSQAFNDDGEPSGTASKPMLHVLTQRGIGDCLAVVVRIFGGIKLGAGGLVRAYSGAVSGALDAAQWHWVTPTHRVRVTLDFPFEQRLRQWLEERDIAIESVDYHQRVSLTLSVPQDRLESCRTTVQTITSGDFDWRELG